MNLAGVCCITKMKSGSDSDYFGLELLGLGMWCISSNNSVLALQSRGNRICYLHPRENFYISHQLYWRISIFRVIF